MLQSLLVNQKGFRIYALFGGGQMTVSALEDSCLGGYA